MIDPAPFKGAKQFFELTFHRRKSAIMADFRAKRRVFDAGLIWIDLPRVKIEYRRTPFPAIHLTNGPMGKAIGQQPEKSTSTSCNGAAAKARSCDRELNKAGIQP